MYDLLLSGQYLYVGKTPCAAGSSRSVFADFTLPTSQRPDGSKRYQIDMKLTLGAAVFWLSMAMAQGQAVGQERLLNCTSTVVEDYDCAQVIAPVACYNQFKFNSASTFTCIEGKDDADKARMVSRPPR